MNSRFSDNFAEDNKFLLLSVLNEDRLPSVSRPRINRPRRSRQLRHTSIFHTTSPMTFNSLPNLVRSLLVLSVLCPFVSQAQSPVSSSSQLPKGHSIKELRSQSSVQPHRVIMLDGEHPGEDSIRSIMDSFYYDQFRHFKDPQAPFFLFMSREANLTMGIGGQLNVQGYYDWGQAMSGSSFIPSSLPVPGEPGNRHILNGRSTSPSFFPSTRLQQGHEPVAGIY